ncbi:uncharacterized protein LOC134774410 [Penaeus indicus]|uniref:uncharacterized protein LOC134774410 n=1 Tax=Penaeus indicus TaxID=29960 RepID=UPI00300D5132
MPKEKAKQAPESKEERQLLATEVSTYHSVLLFAPTEGPVQNVSKEEVRKAIKSMKLGKAAGCSGVTIELIKTLDEEGVEIIHSILEIKQLQKKYWEGKKDLFFCFVDLEKAYSWIPRELVYWCLRNVPEKLIRLLKAIYYSARTVVRTPYGETEEFNIDIGLHQGSALSPFLFVSVLDVISELWRTGVPWEILFADDLMLMAESEEELQEKWEAKHEGIPKKGLKVYSRNKIKESTSRTTETTQF